jgi:hypothetical protein
MNAPSQVQAVPGAPPATAAARPVVPVWLAKEARALLPGWLATLVGPGLLLWQGGAAWTTLAWLFYCFGCLGLAAASLGQEFGCGTLSCLLSQPQRRVELWWHKMAVLGGALITVAGAATLVALEQGSLETFGLEWGERTTSAWAKVAWLLLPPLGAFCTTPWLTLLTRHSLAASVFSLAIPAGLWIATTLIMQTIFGQDWDNVAGLAHLVLFLGLLAFAFLCGLVLGPQTFARLEVADTPTGHLSLPDAILRRFGASSARPAPSLGRPLGKFLTKELYLQQWCFVTAAMFLAGVFALAVVHGSRSTFEPMDVLAPLYWGVICLLAGALTCAEERHFGTLEWQLTLPMALWKQWLAKVVATVGLALVLGLGLAALLVALQRPLTGEREIFDLETVVWGLWATVWLTTLAIYTSSLSRSAARAFLGAIAMAFASILLFGGLQWAVDEAGGWPRLLAERLGRTLRSSEVPGLPSLRHLAQLFFSTVPIAANLVLGYSNYRQPRPSRTGLVIHLSWFGLSYGLAGFAFMLIRFRL